LIGRQEWNKAAKHRAHSPARSVPVGDGRTADVAYNGVDSKHKLVLDHEVTNEVTDRSLLSQMSERAKEALRVGELDVLADMCVRWKSYIRSKLSCNLA
jgi:hypothetical protein